MVNFSAFGLGTMVYIGLEFGSWFEVPWDSPCYQAVRGVNPVLQLIFTFSQMYFVFMNSRVSPLTGGEGNLLSENLCLPKCAITFDNSMSRAKSSYK